MVQIGESQEMEFKYLIYKQKELAHGGRLPEGAHRLFLQLRRKNVTVAGVPCGTLAKYMDLHGIEPESALVIAAADATLEEARRLLVPSLGYKNPDFASEGLFGTDFVAEGFEEIDYYFLERVYQRGHKIPWRVIETKRCYLREMTPEDLPDLYRLYEGEGMTEYMEPLYEWEQEMAYVKAYIENMYRFYGYGMWLVKDRIDDRLIGRAGFDHYTANGKCMLEMGYAIGVPYQRKGYATEVCRALIAYAKGAGLLYDGLYCFVREKNEASIALLLKLGFEFQKITVRDGKKMRRYALKAGRKKDVK